MLILLFAGVQKKYLEQNHAPLYSEIVPTPLYTPLLTYKNKHSQYIYTYIVYVYIYVYIYIQIHKYILYTYHGARTLYVVQCTMYIVHWVNIKGR